MTRAEILKEKLAICERLVEVCRELALLEETLQKARMLETEYKALWHQLETLESYEAKPQKRKRKHKKPDLRPKCCRCGTRWLPPEDVDAQETPCDSCNIHVVGAAERAKEERK
jgi:hypothetical protein